MLRVVFMGTPPFAVPSLSALHAGGYPILSVFTQPDRPVGRGRKLTAPPVKQKAQEFGLEIYQPETLKGDESHDYLAQKNPEVIVVVGYGRIIPQRILDLPSCGCVNVHSSLLPKYRGAAPINWAVVRGETRTGVTTMRLVKKLDAGDILLKRETVIGEDEYANELTERLAQIGADLLIETLQGIEAGAIEPQPQDEEQATYAPIMKREDGLIDWSLSAREIYNRVRGFDPWPGAYTFFRGKRLHIHRARPADGAAAKLGPGELAVEDERLLVGCGDGALEPWELQAEGKRRMGVVDFVNGYQPAPGERVGEENKH